MVVMLTVAVIVPVIFFVPIFTMRVIMMANDQLVSPGGEPVRARPLEGVLWFEELGIQLRGTAKIEAADVQDAVEREIAVFRAMYPRDCIDAVNT